MSTTAKKFLNTIGKRASFGELLLSLRETDEVTQAELARAINVSRSLICDIEKKRRMVSIKLAMKIAKVMGYPEQVLIKYALQDQLKTAKANFKIRIEAA